MTINKNLPNCITALRIVGTVVLLFPTPLSVPFFIVYVFTGLTDALDGWLARKTGTTSELGSRLDSIADILFYTVMLVKILPTLVRVLPWFTWILVGSALAIRAGAYVLAFIKYHRFASVHTYMNKLTGLSIFCYPFFLPTPAAVPIALCVSAVGILASLEELLIHAVAKQYSENTKTLFSLH